VRQQEHADADDDDRAQREEIPRAVRVAATQQDGERGGGWVHGARCRHEGRRERGRSGGAGCRRQAGERHGAARQQRRRVAAEHHRR